ncbi:MAG: HD family hydrolase [Promethearchaeota archaeon]
MTLFQFIMLCDNLKRVLRTGWLLRGVPPSQAENVAAHSHTTSILAFLLAQQAAEPVDLLQVLLMALIHDIPEVEIGDIPMSAQRADPRIREAKTKAENNVMKKILDLLPQGLQTEMTVAWSAYTQGTSIEARIVEVADRLATSFHAAQLVKSGYPAELFQEFVEHATSTATKLKVTQANSYLKELQKTFGE